MLKLFVMAQILRGRMADLLADPKGVTSMEYGVIAATTVLVTGAAMLTLRQPLTDLWAAVVGDLAVP